MTRQREIARVSQESWPQFDSTKEEMGNTFSFLADLLVPYFNINIFLKL